MAGNILKNKLWLGLVLCLALGLSYSDAFAWGRSGRGGGHEVVIVGHDRYHYRSGRFYRSGWFGIEFAVSVPPIGAVVGVLPFGYRTVIVSGIPYYYYDNIYYRSCPTGYIVAQTPQTTTGVVYASVVTQPQTASGQTVIINVPNSNGSYTSVKLVRHNSGYIGPQGEYYEGNPTVDQLKALYGR